VIIYAAVVVLGTKETIDKSNFSASSIFEFALEFCACLMPALIAAQLTPLIFNNKFFIANLILPPSNQESANSKIEDAEKLDLSIVSFVPKTTTAAVFTQNVFCAAHCQSNFTPQ
jgi:hypothetical protein